MSTALVAKRRMDQTNPAPQMSQPGEAHAISGNPGLPLEECCIFHPALKSKHKPLACPACWRIEGPNRPNNNKKRPSLSHEALACCFQFPFRNGTRVLIAPPWLPRMTLTFLHSVEVRSHSRLRESRSMVEKQASNTTFISQLGKKLGVFS